MEVDFNMGVTILNNNLNVNTNSKLIETETLSSNTVGVGNMGAVDITPASGYKAKLKGLYINVPAISGTATGTHMVSIYIGDALMYRINVTSPATQGITIEGLAVLLGTPIPSSDGAIVNVIKDAMFNNTLPLAIRYSK